jgi:RNA 3'-terminal phosphate cyclase (ATP)
MKPLEKRRERTRRERRLDRRRRGDGEKKDTMVIEKRSVSLVELDGGEGEGGGQILRIAFSTSFLTSRGISIHSIRKNRSTPGFRAQHLAGANLVRDLCGARFTGGEIRSTACTFVPPEGEYPDLPKEIVVDPKTAGAISLIIQIVLPCMLYLSRPLTLRIRGGTDVSFSPPIDYVSNVLLPALFGRKQDTIKLKVERRGFYPVGGGMVTMSVNHPSRSSLIQPVRMYRQGRVEYVRIFIVVWGSEAEERKQYAKAIEIALKEMWSKRYEKDVALLKDVQIIYGVTRKPKRKNKKKSGGTCFTINIAAYTETGCVLAHNVTDENRNKSLDKRIEDSCHNKLLKEFERDVIRSGACCDEHLADQLLIFMALARGVSVLRYPEKMSSKHFSTAIDVLKKMIPSVSFEILDIKSITASSLTQSLRISDEHAQKDLVNLHRDVLDSVAHCDVDVGKRTKLLICHGAGR